MLKIHLVDLGIVLVRNPGSVRSGMRSGHTGYTLGNTSTLALLSTQLSLLDPFIACWR